MSLHPELDRELRALRGRLSPDAAQALMRLVAPYFAADHGAGIRIDRDIAYGEDERHVMDAFRPDVAAQAGRPALVFVHGGGFVGGDKSELWPFHDNVGVWAARHGVVGFNINYRLAPAHAWPAAAQDVGAAVQWIREHAPGYGVDPQRVVLLGHSAGAAHVAAYAADRQRSAQAIAGAALVSGIYDLGTMTLTPGRVAYFGSDAAQLAARSTLAGLADSGLPLFVSVAEDDPPEITAQAMALLQRAQQARGSLPAFVRASGHNHFSTILHLGAFDTPFSLELIDFVLGSRVEPNDTR